MIRTDYEKNLSKYVKSINKTKLDAIIKACGIALRSLDAQYVSMADDAEIGRVCAGFAAKKLGLTAAATKKALKTVEKIMHDERSKMRTTVYYLLAKQTGTLDKLGAAAAKKTVKKAKKPKKAKKAVKKVAKKPAKKKAKKSKKAKR
jgi:hypothetical protein